MQEYVVSAAPRAPAPVVEVLRGDGEMGALMRSIDWAKTPVGPVETWPQSLRTPLSILLGSQRPLLLLWGKEMVQFYNDAYRPILGDTKHPAAMGQRARVCWEEVWEDVSPMFAKAFAGAATNIKDGLFLLSRYGFFEECYFDYAFDPIRDETGAVAGILVVAHDTTARVIGERRLKMLRELSERTALAGNLEGVFRAVEEVLTPAASDVPFALVYEVRGPAATLVACAGLTPGSRPAPWTFDVGGAASWPLGAVLRSGEPMLVEDVDGKFDVRIPGASTEALTRALVVPMSRAESGDATTVLIAGLSPRLRLNDDYRNFILLLARQMFASISSTRAFEQEKQSLARERALQADLIALLEGQRLADIRKDEFLAMLAHELRNPMAAISIALSMLEQARGDDVRTARHHAIAKRQMGNLVRMVDDLLDVARITRGKVELRREIVDFAAIVDNALAATRPVIDARRHAMSVAIAPGSFRLDADSARIEQILVNLLTNAAKYTEVGGTISVRLDHETVDGVPHAVLRVCDSGRGISSEMLGEVFELFVQVTTKLDRDAGGLGLGLTLVKRLVEMHGGSVSANSRGLGKGSEFVVCLPLAAEGEPAQVVMIDGLPRRPRPVSRRQRILVVEDAADLREIVKELLEELGHEVEVAEDGAKGLARLLEMRPDVALVDVGLPGIDGYELARRVRSAPGGAALYLVALTGYGGSDAKTEAQRAGFDEHTTKPVALQDLLRVVNRSMPAEELGL